LLMSSSRLFSVFSPAVRAAAVEEEMELKELGAVVEEPRMPRRSGRSATSRPGLAGPISTEEVEMVVGERVSLGPNSRRTLLLTKKMQAPVKSVRDAERVVAKNLSEAVRVKAKHHMREKHARVKEHPQVLRVVGIDLKCMACDKIIPSHRTHTTAHMVCDMHLQNTVKKLKALVAAIKEADFIKAYFQESRAKGETLDIEYRCAHRQAAG